MQINVTEFLHICSIYLISVFPTGYMEFSILTLFHKEQPYFIFIFSDINHSEEEGFAINININDMPKPNKIVSYERFHLLKRKNL
jgi:hypothetical protein